jgi:uncharacterized protein (TIGR03435 family)
MYALVVAKNGPRLKPAPPERECPAGATCGHVGGGPGIGLSGLGAEVSDLAAALSALIDREVIDRTGIQGRFDIELPRWSRSQLTVQATADTSDASIFTVLQEQLGLRLESTHGPLDVYTVDHVEWPSEN